MHGSRKPREILAGRQQTPQLELCEDKHGWQELPAVTDNLGSRPPVAARELDVIESYLGELLTELLQSEVDEELG